MIEIKKQEILKITEEYLHNIKEYAIPGTDTEEFKKAVYESLVKSYETPIPIKIFKVISDI